MFLRIFKPLCSLTSLLLSFFGAMCHDPKLDAAFVRVAGHVHGGRLRAEVSGLTIRLVGRGAQSRARGQSRSASHVAVSVFESHIVHNTRRRFCVLSPPVVGSCSCLADPVNFTVWVWRRAARAPPWRRLSLTDSGRSRGVVDDAFAWAATVPLAIEAVHTRLQFYNTGTQTSGTKFDPTCLCQWIRCERSHRHGAGRMCRTTTVTARLFSVRQNASRQGFRR